MRLASAADFIDGPMYSEYRHFECHAERAELLTELYPVGSVLVVGCAWGFVVQELLDRGWDAWGIDASEWAVSMAYVSIDAPARVLFGNATDPADMDAACARAGVERFDLAVTDDILPALTDAEIQRGVTQCRRVARNVLHCVTPKPASETTLELNWKPIGVWRELLAPDLVRDEETGQVE